jgi:hypothetical protein
MTWGFLGTWVERMHRAGAVVIMRPRSVSERELAAAIVPGYSGGVQTDRIEAFAGWMRAASARAAGPGGGQW